MQGNTEEKVRLEVVRGVLEAQSRAFEVLGGEREGETVPYRTVDHSWNV